MTSPFEIFKNDDIDMKLTEKLPNSIRLWQNSNNCRVSDIFITLLFLTKHNEIKGPTSSSIHFQQYISFECFVRF